MIVIKIIMIFKHKDKNYEVEIIKKDNKNTYIRVRDDKIYVTTNYFTSQRKIAKLLEENRKAVVKMIDKAEIRAQKRELFLLFGKYYDIIYGEFERQITIEDSRILVINEKVLCNWLDKIIHTTFYNRLMYWYGNFDGKVPYPNLKIRKMKTRWGVCNTKNYNVTLNFELFRYDIKCLDYVIIHELSHFLVPNHSKEFWRVVETYCPDYKEIRKTLKN